MKLTQQLLIIIFVFSLKMVLSQDIPDFDNFKKQIKKEDYPQAHIEVYRTGDSIKNALVKTGIDNIILYYKSQKDYLRNEDHTIDKHLCILFWQKDNIIYQQRINDYAVYEALQYSTPILNYIFQFYSANANTIDQEHLQSKPIFLFQDKYSTKKASKDDLYIESESDSPLTILEYKIAGHERWLFWQGLNTSDYGNRNAYGHSLEEDIFYQDLDKKIFTWAMLIERSYRPSLLLRWKPLNMKFISDEDLEERLKKMEVMYYKYWPSSILYKFQRQEFLLPKGFKGRVTIIQEVPCGQSLFVKRGKRLLKIGNTGVLRLKEDYIHHSPDFAEPESKKTTFYRGSQKLPVLQVDDKKNSSNEIGLFILGSTYQEGEVNFLEFFVGTHKELDAFAKNPQGKIDFEKVLDTERIENLKNCNDNYNQ
jgi:hypothetical protein